MLHAELLCRAIEFKPNNSLCLVKGDSASEEVWLYVLLNQKKAPLLMGMAKLFPLKLKLRDYGKVIKSGNGANPPANIIKQMENADLSNQNPGHESQIFFLECHDSQHRHFYTYLDVPYYLHDKFEIIKDSAGEFELTEYGEILHSDWGHPTEEIKQMMHEKYGIKTPEPEKEVEHA